MKDFKGIEIKVGDTIICGEKPGSSGCYLVERKVVQVEANKVKVAFLSEKWNGQHHIPVMKTSWRGITRNICVLMSERK
jgi:hypothetical protein